MIFLDYAKQYHNFDVFLVLLDDAGYSDDEIVTKFKVAKQRIYDARKRLTPIIEAIEHKEPYKIDGRDPEVQTIIDEFTETFGTTATSRYDRFAAKRLAGKHGPIIIRAMMNALSTYSDDEYCPVVNSVSEFERKLPSIFHFLKKKGSGPLDITL